MLNEYKKTKLAEVDNFFRGIYFENIGNAYEIIIENISVDSEIINLDFINTNKICRAWAEKTLLEIKSLRSELEDTYLEMSSSKEEIDIEIGNFVNKIMIILNKLRNNILEDFHTRKNIKKNASSYIESDLDFFKVILGKQEHIWQDTQNAKTRVQGETTKVYEKVDDIRVILAYIYALPNMRMNKIKMQEKLHEMRNDFQIGTNEYNQLMHYYLVISNGKNYDIIKKTYETAIEELEGKKKARG